MRRKMRSATPAASHGNRGDRAGAVRRAGGGHAPHVVLPLREHTHVPVKRESETFGDGSSTAETTRVFCAKRPIALQVCAERKLELQTQRLSFETSERQAPIMTVRTNTFFTTTAPVMSAKECARAPVPQHRRFRWPRTRRCASRRCARTAARDARAKEKRGAASGGPPPPVAARAGFRPRGWRWSPERPRRDAARRRRTAASLRGTEALKRARDRVSARRVRDGRATRRTCSP